MADYCSNISMEKIFINTENRKTTKPHKLVLNLSQRLDLKSSNKHVALPNLPIYYTWKNIRQQYKNNKVWIAGRVLFSFINWRLYLVHYKKHKTLTANQPIQIYINRINNRLVFKIKYGYKLELQTPETVKLFGRMGKMYRVLKWLK